MGDKEWLLNANAIKKAKTCINLIESELDIRLKLTHPQFREMIKDYAELTDSRELQKAYLELSQLAESGSESIPILRKKVVNMPHFGETEPGPAPKARAVTHSELALRNEGTVEETVKYKGKVYPKYNDSGLQFKGLYRGQARYA